MDSKTHFTVANTTNMRRAAFTVTGLMPGTGYVVSITAGNSKGRSQPVRLHAFTTKLPDQLAESGTKFKCEWKETGCLKIMYLLFQVRVL